MVEEARLAYLEDSKDEIDSLKFLAGTGDVDAFVKEAQRLNWSRRLAGDIVQGVRLALGIGAHRLARDLACEGAARYPSHDELQKMARILGPPQGGKTMPSDSSVRLNQTWLREHADHYTGRWVAIQDGDLIAVGETAREVWESLENPQDVLLTKVY